MDTSLSDLRFVFNGGPMDGQTLNLDFQKMTLGRDLNCDLTLDDPKLSRRHCYLQIEGDDVYVYDLGSTNGTFVNGRPIMRERLEPDDVITIGLTDLVLKTAEEFQTINFSASDTVVTNEVKMRDGTGESLAEQFKNIFDFYKDYQPEMSGVEQVELVKTQRLLNSMQSLQTVSAQMSRLLPVEELLKVIAQGLFDVFAGAENLVILLKDEDAADEPESFRPAYARDRTGDEKPKITISSTVLNRAIQNRSTLVANDIGHDSSFNVQESIVRFDVKSAICCPLVSNDQVLGALYMDNRQQKIHYDRMDAELVTVFANQAAIAIENAALCDSLQQAYVQTLQSLVSAIEAKDNYTRGHSQRVKKYCQAISKNLGLKDGFINRIGVAAELHDIGKIGVSEGIINKPGTLTDQEYRDIRNHVDLGIRILEPIKHLKDVIPWIHGHHERWDGKGYPRKLKGEENPIGGRIMAVADAFDAMTSQRAYNTPMSFLTAAKKIESESGSAFDPIVAAAMVDWITNQETQQHNPDSYVDDDTSDTGEDAVQKPLTDSTKGKDVSVPDKVTDYSDFS